MRVAVFSDIHANWPALNCAIADAQAQGVQRYWSLGDVVDRGNDALQCLEWVWEHCEVHLIGNHEEALLRYAGREFPPHPVFKTPDRVGIDLSAFSGYTLQQSLRQLAGTHLDRIMQQSSAAAVLPNGAVVPLTETQPETRPDIVLVHGSPENTTHWRIREDHDAIAAFAELRGWAETFQPPGLPRIIFAGHTHQARAWQVALEAWTAREYPLHPGKPLALADSYWTITVGSIGEPRDRDTTQQGSYGILDTDARTFTRRLVV